MLLAGPQGFLLKLAHLFRPDRGKAEAQKGFWCRCTQIRMTHSERRHPSKHDLAAHARQLLLLDRKHDPPVSTQSANGQSTNTDAPRASPDEPAPDESRRCPQCGKGALVLIGRLTSKRYGLPPARDRP